MQSDWISQDRFRLQCHLRVFRKLLPGNGWSIGSSYNPDGDLLERKLIEPKAGRDLFNQTNDVRLVGLTDDTHSPSAGLECGGDREFDITIIVYIN